MMKPCTELNMSRMNCVLIPFSSVPMSVCSFCLFVHLFAPPPPLSLSPSLSLSLALSHAHTHTHARTHARTHAHTHTHRHNRGTESIHSLPEYRYELAVRQTENSSTIFQAILVLPKKKNVRITCIAYSFSPLHETPDILGAFLEMPYFTDCL